MSGIEARASPRLKGKFTGVGLRMTKICSVWQVVHLGLVLIISLGAFASAESNGTKEDMPHANVTNHCHGAEENQRYEVVSLEWEEVEVPFGICVWIMIASLAKLGFHYTRLPELLPESCLLIIIGFVVGGIISINPDVFPESLASGLDTNLFFLFLLPPIMLEAGYFMPSRSFFDNIGTILMYAVFGTLFNTMTIGFSLYGISQLGWYSVGSNETVHISLLECLTFSSLISAVDPVAVLAVFEEVHVNEVLYILVFGESLLNDAVTVVLYRMFESFNAIGADELMATDIIGGFFSFFVVSIGGVLIGLFYGVLTSLLTRLTHKARVIEPIFVFAMAYMSYLTAEMFRLSSILAIVFCAIFMKPYVESNISQKSHTTIKYFLKMLSSISETIIFIFLGVTTLVDLNEHKWNTFFVIFTLIFCLLYRSIGVIMQTWVANTFRLARICKTEQFIMAYGGLRGAIAFSLVALLCKETVLSKPIMFTTCIVVIMFTVFIQGTTIKPLVDKLNVKRATKHKPSMNEEIFERLGDHLMVGIEEILGQYGHHHWRDKWENFNKRFVEPILLHERKIGDPKILEVFGKLNEKDAKDYIKSHGSFILHSEQSLSSMLRTQSSDVLCMSSSTPFSALPVNDSVPCLDMQQIGTNVPAAKLTHETSSHHLDLLANNMYKPQRHNHRMSRNMDNDIQEPSNLMHRSMRIQLRRMSLKQNGRHSKSTNPLLNLALHNSSSDRHLLRRHHLEHNHNKEPEHLAASDEHPAVIVTLEEEDEDEGITFSAKESFDEPDMGIDKTTEEVVQTACEKTLPWKTENSPEVSVRAEINPHQFVMAFPVSPRKVPPKAPPLLSPSDSTTDDAAPLTAAERLPWKSSSEPSSSSHESLTGAGVPGDGTVSATQQDAGIDVDFKNLENIDYETRL